MNEDLNPRYARMGEAAELLAVSEATVRKWLYAGTLEGIKVGRIARVDLRSIDKLPDAHRYQDVARQIRISALVRLLSLRWKDTQARVG